MSSKVVVMNATFSTRLEKPKSKGGSPETDKRTFGWLLTLDWGGLEDLGHKQFVACGRAATAERRSVHRFHGGRRTNRQRSGRAGRLQTARLMIIEQGAGATDDTTMHPRDSKRAKPLPNSTLIEALDNNLLIRCASYLDADSLVRLGRASTMFGTPQDGQQRSLVNEAAHQLFRQSATDEERSCLPKHDDESDIGLYRALEKLRQPLSFDELAGNGFSPQEHPAHVTHTPPVWSTAVSGHVMRGGRHFVEFTITSDYTPFVYLGVMRPVSLTNGIDLEADWGDSVDPVQAMSRTNPALLEYLISQRTAKWGDSDIHCCSYFCYGGRCIGSDWDGRTTDDDWHGREGLEGSGTIGLLLDLDEGTLSVFKNSRRLGVMKEGGLNGEYCWFVSVCSSCDKHVEKSSSQLEDWCFPQVFLDQIQITCPYFQTYDTLLIL